MRVEKREGKNHSMTASSLAGLTKMLELRSDGSPARVARV